MSTETKFTKGEWEVSEDGLSVGANGFKVARVHSGCATPYVQKTTNNAHLIAAAPKMYEMIDTLSRELQSAIREVNNNRGVNNRDPLSQSDFWDEETLHDAQLLLAQARGE